MSAGLSHLSDAELMQMLGQSAPSSASAPPLAAPAPAAGGRTATESLAIKVRPNDAVSQPSSLAHLSDEDLMKQLGAAPPPATAQSTAWDVAKSIPSGLARGVMSVAGMPADLMNLADQGWQHGAAYLLEKAGALTPEQASEAVKPIPGLEDTRTRGLFPSSGLLRDATDAGLKKAGLPELYKPKTIPGEFANTVSEFAPGGLLSPGTTAQRVMQAMFPAVASETAGQGARHFAPGYEGLARLVGGVGGGVGTAMAQAPKGGSGSMRSVLKGVSPEKLDEAAALIERSRALPGGGVGISLDEALNTVTGGQATRASQIARVVSHSGGEGQNIASGFYSKRPDEIEQTSRKIFDLLASKTESPSALGASVQDAARSGVAQTPEGVALAEARAAAGPRVTPETAGLHIQPELRQVYDRREGMRAALADQDYAAARQAPETVGIERTIPVERAGEPIITYPQGRPTFTDRAPRPLDPPPTAEAGVSGGPESLARFIARRGGLKLDGEAAATDLHRFNIPGVGNVARADGRSIDNHWRESLIEHGYLRPDLDGGAARDISSELLRKLQNEQRGFPSYPIGAERQAASARAAPGQVADEYRNALSLSEGRLDADLRSVGIDPGTLHPEIRSRTLGALMRGEHADPLDAYERTVGGMNGPLSPYSKSTTVVDEISAPRFGQANPQPVIDHVDEALRSAKGPVASALQQARKTLFEQDGRTPDLSVAGLHGAREAIGDLIARADPTAQRALMGVRERLDRSLAAVPEYEHARSGFEAASRTLDPFDMAPGKIVGQRQETGRFTLPPERVPGAIDEGPSAARAFNDVASPEARRAYEGHLTTRILDASEGTGGSLSAERLRAVMRGEEDQLAQFPAVRERLEGIARAREALAPIERSPLGAIAAEPKVKKTIKTLFDPKPVSGSELEVASAMHAIAKNNPEAARQVARAHLETMFDDATRERKGLPAQYGGAGFASAVAGNPQQLKNLRAVVRALPDGDVLWGGLDRLLGTLKATGYRPQKGSDTSFNRRIEAVLGKESGSVSGAITSVLSGAAAGGGIGGLGGVASGGLLGAKRAASEAWTHMQLLRSGKTVARFLFDPAALPEMRALSRSIPGSPDAGRVASRLLAVMNSGAGGAMQPGQGSAR